jgi:PAS domain S-box-containing protein
MVVAERNVWNALTLPFLTGAITAGLVLLTWLVATMRGIRLITHIIQPIQDLVETTHAIRSGDLSRRALVVQQDEVGELAAAFNDMADQLRHTLDGLQEKITELEQISQALGESETRYRSIFENAQEGIYRASKQGRFLMVNPALVHILGYETAEEVLNLDIANDLYTLPSDRANLLQLLDEKGQITNMEITWKRKDGSQITVSLYTHILYDNHNQIIGYEGLVFDISQRRKMEQERERLIQELEAKNAELERFTYTVSHDLKSPLITIRAYLGSLERDVAVGNMERFRADAQRIVEATNKMQQLLGDLLDLSRVGQKMNPLEIIPFYTLVQEALVLIEGRRIIGGVEVIIAPDLPDVLGDRLRLVEVLQNLLDNACKYMGKQPAPRISIGVRYHNNLGIFWVSDNGIGIEPQYLDKVFGLFDKLDAQSEGTGVGLALVKRIVEMHGGHIWVESQGLGHGSTFYFSLPLA